MARIPYPIIFGGGLNNEASAFDIKDNEASDLRNCHFDEINTIVKRNGYLIEGNDIGNYLPLGLGGYIYMSSGSATRSKYVVVNGASNAKIYKDVSGTWTVQTPTLTNNKYCQFVQANNSLYEFNGTDAVQKLNNVTWSSLASGVPMSGSNNIGYFGCWHNNMMFVAKTNTNPSRVYISALGNPEDYTGGYYLDINPEDGEPITGIAEISNYVAVFKSKGIYLIAGYSPDDLSVIAKEKNYGAVSSRSIVRCKDVLLFQNSDGHIYSFDTSSTILQSSPITGTINGLNMSYINLSAGVFFDNKYHLAVPYGSSTINNYVLVFDLIRSQVFGTENKVWTVYDSIQASDWLVFHTTGYADKLYFCESSADSKVYEMYSGTNDNGSAINFYYVTKNYDLQDRQRDKKLKYIYTDAQALGNWDLTLSYSVDGATDFANLGTINLTAGGWILDTSTLPVTLADGFLADKNTLIIPSSSRYVKYKYSQAGLNQTCRIYSSIMYFRYGKLRKRIKST